MEPAAPESSQNRSSALSEEQLQEAQRNLEMCLDALDQKGEEGLQEALDQVYPDTDLVSEFLPAQGPLGVDMHAVRVRGVRIPLDP